MITVDSRLRRLEPLATTPLFDVVVDLQSRLDIGEGPHGRRVFFGATGGVFHGPKIHGEVVPGGGDSALFRPDGTMVIDVRLTLRTYDGALVQMTYGGRWVTPREVRPAIADTDQRSLVDPACYYFRTNPLFETGSVQYSWLNDIVCVGSGYLVDGGVAYHVEQVL